MTPTPFCYIYNTWILAIEDSGPDEGGGDSGKWTTEEVSTFLDVYENFKPPFDEPYPVKFRIWKRIKSNIFLKSKIYRLCF